MGFYGNGIIQEKKNIRPTFSAEHIYGGTLLAMCSSDFICFYDWAECRLIRRIDVNVKVCTNISLNSNHISLVLVICLLIFPFSLVAMTVLECLLG